MRRGYSKLNLHAKQYQRYVMQEIKDKSEDKRHRQELGEIRKENERKAMEEDRKEDIE